MKVHLFVQSPFILQHSDKHSVSWAGLYLFLQVLIQIHANLEHGLNCVMVVRNQLRNETKKEMEVTLIQDES
jgi:hypothetical protein